MDQPIHRKFKVSDLIKKISKWNIRKTLVDRDIDKLAVNIRSQGIIHPPVVIVNADGEIERVEDGVLAGQRRVLAAERAGLEEIWCQVRTIDSDIEAILLSLSEGSHTVETEAEDKAEAITYLMEHDMSAIDIANRLGISRDTVYMYRKYKDDVRPEIKDKGLGVARANKGEKAMSSLEGAGQHEEAKRVLDNIEEIPVRVLDNIPRQVKAGAEVKVDDMISSNRGWISQTLNFEPGIYTQFATIAKSEGLIPRQAFEKLMEEVVERGYVCREDS
jgi:ParB/RepB/Spo0J family partition protein